MTESTVAIGGRLVGDHLPCFIIAELSANHLGSLERALSLCRAAKSAGADAVKVQTYTPDTITANVHDSPFLIRGGGIGEGRTLYDLYAEAHMPWEWHAPLQREADRLGLSFFSSPFDATAVDFLEQLGVPAFKIASFELVDLPLLRRVAATGKPLIVSTGMASAGEISEALQVIGQARARTVLLKCTSAYPALPDQMNLRTIPDMRERFGVPIGLSDHSMDPAIAVAAVTLGACVLEKHLTLRRADGGPDASFSLEPQEFAETVRSVRQAEAALGRVSYGDTTGERATRQFRRSLFVVRPVHAGEPFTRENVRSIRPGDGLHTRYFEHVLQRSATRDVEAGAPLAWDLVDGGAPDE